VTRKKPVSSAESDTYVSLLRGFECELDQMTFRNGIHICRLERGKHWDDDTRFAGAFDADNSFVMEYEVASAEQHKAAFEAFQNTVTAMRLTGPGAVFMGDLLKPQNLMIQHGSRFGAPVYRLTTDTVDAVDTLAVTLAKGVGDPTQGGISRFNIGYDRLTGLVLGAEAEEQQAGDMLIDYWIALESLFLPDEGQELSYRISLRVACFIATSPPERQAVFREIRRSYRLRSALVHGRTLNDDVRRVTHYTENALRRALNRAVQSPEDVNVDRLDDAIVMGLPAISIPNADAQSSAT
jgi:hypothetical protein